MPILKVHTPSHNYKFELKNYNLLFPKKEGRVLKRYDQVSSTIHVCYILSTYLQLSFWKQVEVVLSIEISMVNYQKNLQIYIKISKQFSVDFIKQKNMPEGAFLSLDFEVQNLTVFVQSTSDKLKVFSMIFEMLNFIANTYVNVSKFLIKCL